jgi:hypothetical protein
MFIPLSSPLGNVRLLQLETYTSRLYGIATNTHPSNDILLFLLTSSFMPLPVSSLAFPSAVRCLHTAAALHQRLFTRLTSTLPTTSARGSTCSWPILRRGTSALSHHVFHRSCHGLEVRYGEQLRDRSTGHVRRQRLPARYLGQSTQLHTFAACTYRIVRHFDAEWDLARFEVLATWFVTPGSATFHECWK